jgi:uncharacterized membrane protein (DUF4010 family)
MLGRIGILTSVAGPRVLPPLAPFLGATALGGAGGAAVLAVIARRARPQGEAAPALTNPFRLQEAIRFALLYGLVLLVVEAARRWLGSWGIAAAALLAGLTDVDAITLSLAGLAGSDLAPESAARAIALAALSNTAAKAAYAAWLGDRSFRRAVLLVLGSAFAAGAAALLILIE